MVDPSGLLTLFRPVDDVLVLFIYIFNNSVISINILTVSTRHYNIIKPSVNSFSRNARTYRRSDYRIVPRVEVYTKLVVHFTYCMYLGTSCTKKKNVSVKAKCEFRATGLKT